MVKTVKRQKVTKSGPDSITHANQFCNVETITPKSDKNGVWTTPQPNPPNRPGTGLGIGLGAQFWLQDGPGRGGRGVPQDGSGSILHVDFWLLSAPSRGVSARFSKWPPVSWKRTPKKGQKIITFFPFLVGHISLFSYAQMSGFRTLIYYPPDLDFRGLGCRGDQIPTRGVGGRDDMKWGRVGK